VVLATYRDDFYNVVLALHILCAVIGFGAVALNGLYAQQIKNRLQQGRVGEALAVHEANMKVSQIGEYFIYAVFILGLVVLELAKVGDTRVYKFGQTWVWLSIVLYIVGLGLSHGIMMPGAKRMKALMQEMVSGPPPAGGAPPQVAEMQTIGQRMGVVGPILDLILVVIIFLMVLKPGGP
jgi:uncharacterized membrane protein